MLGLLIFLFTIVPIVELFLLIQVGQLIGAGSAIGIVLLTGFLGAFLARSQGRQIFFRIQKELQSGGLPADSLIQGLMVFVGGLLLITPGFLTDTFGFALVFPWTRVFFLKFFKNHFKRAVRSGAYRVHTVNMGRPGEGGFHVYQDNTFRNTDSQSEQEREVVEVQSEKIEGETKP